MNLKLILIFAVIIKTSQCLNNTEEEIDHKKDFDFLVFAQVWPISGCLEWEDRSDKNTCYLPNRKNWTVHGIWPTKPGKKGPFDCDHSKPYNHGLIEPILPNLRLHWTNVRANTDEDNFWKHEWNKHGTCAMVLEPMDNELKYFSKGLEFNERFPISQILAAKGLTPGHTYSSEEIINAMSSFLSGSKPALECENMHDFVLPVLTQISVCLDKQLNVMGCENAFGGVYGRCPKNGFIEYPKTENKNINGTSGAIWGMIIGGAIFLAFVCYMIKRGWHNRRRNRGYEEI